MKHRTTPLKSALTNKLCLPIMIGVTTSLSLVKREKVNVGVILNLCRELVSQTKLVGPEVVGSLGECALELYLKELCEGCDALVDNRTTLRRYFAVFDLELKRWLYGPETTPTRERLLYLSDFLYKALRKGETWIHLRPIFEVSMFMPEGRGWKGLNLDHHVLPLSIESALSRLLKENLERYRDLILEGIKKLVAGLFDDILKNCSYIIGLSNASMILSHGVADVLCLRVSKSHYRGELQVYVKLTNASQITIGSVKVPVDVVIGDVVRIVAIEVKTSTIEPDVDLGFAIEFKRRLEKLKEDLKVPVDGYLVHVYHDIKQEVAFISIYKMLLQ